MMKVSQTGNEYFNFDVYDFSEITFSTNTGELTVVVPVQVADKELGMRVRFSREASHKLWVQLGRMQEALEKVVQESPSSDARH